MGPNELRVETGANENRAETHLFIDGVELVDSQRPSTRVDGTPYPEGHRKRFNPADPVGLLPPESRLLLPSATPSSAMVGICGCGESGCGSLYLRVRRDDAEVVWEPEPDAPHHTIEATWRFELRQYLDAIDAGTATMTWAARPLVLATELRRRRDSHWGCFWGEGYRLLNVRAWPDLDDKISVLIAGPNGMHWRELAVPADRTDEEIITDLEKLT